MIKNILFDIDGTLLRVNKEAFKARFFTLLRESKHIKEIGGADLFLDAFRKMHHGDGDLTNEALLLRELSLSTGLDKKRIAEKLSAFYACDFPKMRSVFEPPCPELQKAVGILKGKGYRLCLATGPVFPRDALVMRLNAAGFDASDFSYISTAENSRYYKNSPDYYTELCESAGLKIDECLMVGNSVPEDMIAAKLGMKCFLMTGFEEGIPSQNHITGGPEAFLKFAEGLPAAEE